MMRFALAASLGLACATARAAPETVLDDFSSLAAWSVEASEGVKASIRPGASPAGPAMCLEFDFGDVSGYAIARRRLPLAYPSNFELSFGIRGEAKPNALQVKLVDASGENVWWNQHARFEFPQEWQPMRIRKRDIGFAWGPSPDHALVKTDSLEIAVARGEGGQGSVCIDRLAMRELPATSEPPPGVVVKSWRSGPAAGPSQTLSIDLGSPREFGGLVLRWLPGLHASSYAVELSDDGEHWRAVREVTAGGGGLDAMALPDSQARYIRLRMRDGPAKSYALENVEVRGLAFGATPNAFFEALAREAPRGRYPRAFSGEQAYWTVVGVDGGAAQGLLSEDGALEARAGEAAIEPMLLTEDGLLTWADVQATHTLAQGYLPIPTATLRRGELALHVTAFGDGEGSRAQVVARYTVENDSDHARRVTLVLALRPFQVNPPAQFLNSPGGVAVTRRLAWTGDTLTVNGVPLYYALERPTRAFASPFEAGNLPDLLANGVPPTAQSVDDPSGFASGALLYRLDVPANGRRSVGLVAPLAGAAMLPHGDEMTWMRTREHMAAKAWEEKLGRVAIDVPAAGQPLVDTIRTALAHVLIDRAGAALQPGTRAYARSWIRDGALMSDALLRMGHEDAVREYAGWFAPHLFASGKVPCCVDARGADPVPENDSHGEWIHLVDAYYRYSHDAVWLATMWRGVEGAHAYMERLRTEAPNGAREPAYAGLMPASISHEGYSDKPAWSYWDDFWALTGYRDAADIAVALGRKREARTFAKQRDEFRADLYRSIAASMASHRIDYIPGSADRGDFDATSTTVALSPGGEGARLPRAWLDATFERYWQEFAARRDGRREWDAYTPYEIRNVGAFVRLGWRERAGALLGFFLEGRRPPGWNQWAEVVGRDERAPRFVGDMPHGWVASDFIRSALDLFAYEHEPDRSLVLAAGVPLAWIDAHGIAVDRLRTPWGMVSFTLRREAQGTVLAVPASSAVPPGGFVVGCPFRAARIRRVPSRVVLGLDRACREPPVSSPHD